MVEISRLPKLSDVLTIHPQRFEDDRGFFMETFRQSWLDDFGISAKFVQDNQSFSAAKGTLRGLHFQYPPHAQGKLIHCIAGRVWDVAVDLRPHSRTFGVWDAQELTASAGELIYIPAGFAHGFITLEEGCVLAYKCTAYYDGATEGGIFYADPDLAIEWPDLGVELSLSPKDTTAGSLRDFQQSQRDMS